MPHRRGLLMGLQSTSCIPCGWCLGADDRCLQTHIAFHVITHQPLTFNTRCTVYPDGRGHGNHQFLSPYFHLNWPRITLFVDASYAPHSKGLHSPSLLLVSSRNLTFIKNNEGRRNISSIPSGTDGSVNIWHPFRVGANGYKNNRIWRKVMWFFLRTLKPSAMNGPCLLWPRCWSAMMEKSERSRSGL